MGKVILVFTLLALALTGLAAPATQTPKLTSPSDQNAFRRWFTFLAESRYYARKPVRDVSDGDSLVRWALRHALAQHDVAWSRKIELPIYPVMPSVSTVRGIPEMASPVLVSRDIADAQPGDLLLYRDETRPAHVMVFIGKSQVVPSPGDWVIYVSERIHKVSLDHLRADPSPDWRPVPGNPEFRGVWRLDLLDSVP